MRDSVDDMSSTNETPQSQAPQVKRPSSEARAFFTVLALLGVGLLLFVLALATGMDVGLGNQGIGLTAAICGLLGVVFLVLGIMGVNRGR